MATIPYVNLSQAQAYFDERLNTLAWDSATDTDKVKALKTATRLINNLKFAGQRNLITQPNEFPRIFNSMSINVPQAIMDATCEIAYQLLDDVDINFEVGNTGVISESYSMVRSQRDGDFVLPYIRAGIPSVEAWMLLLPYLHDPLNIYLNRR